ncbi:MAG: STAS domain-containing protein [Fibrobacterota bacterium]
MELDIQDYHGFKLIAIKGQISHLKDSISLKSLVNSLLEDAHYKIALNLKELEYIDSAAINVFIYTKSQVEKAGGSFCIVEPNDYVLDVINVVGLEQYFKIIQDKDKLR